MLYCTILYIRAYIYILVYILCTYLYEFVKNVQCVGTRARVKWNDNWIAFLDTLTQTHILRTDTRHPCLLTAIEKLVVNVKAHRNILQNPEYQQKGKRARGVVGPVLKIALSIKQHEIPNSKGSKHNSASPFRSKCKAMSPKGKS